MSLQDFEPVTMQQLKAHVVTYSAQVIGFAIIPTYAAIAELSGATFLKLFFVFAIGMFGIGLVITRLKPIQQAQIAKAAMIFPLPPIVNAIMLIAMIGLYFVSPYFTVAIASAVAVYEMAGFSQRISNWADFLERVNVNAR